MVFKFSITILFSLTLLLTSSAQDVKLITYAKSLSPEKDYENIHMIKLYSDSLSSVFCIWIKKEVKLHKHLNHTEQVLVLEGTAQMLLNKSTFEINEGDLITIPKNTPHKVIVNDNIPLKVLSIQSPLFDGSDRILLE